jgi:hypothetical protein
VKKLASAVPAGLFLAWLYFLGFLYVQAYFNEFALQGRVATATVEGLLMTASTALSVGSRPWYMQLPLSLELPLLAMMYWLASQLMPEKRRVTGRLERRRRHAGGTGRRYPAWLLALGLAGFAVGSACLAHHEGKIAARQVRARFAAGGGLRTVFFENGQHRMLGPALGCDQDVCAYLTAEGAMVLDRKLVAAEIPRTRLK